jgi:hypothetical protein
MSQYFSRNEPRILIALQERLLPEGAHSWLTRGFARRKLLSYE